MKVPFVDLGMQYRAVRKEALQGIDRVCKRSNFILGDEVRRFEQEFSAYCRMRYAVGLNSGSDALLLSLLDLNIGKNDEVIVPAFTFIATALAVSHSGARPVFADIDDKTYNIDPAAIKKVISKRTRAIIPVHLFGQTADMNQILKIADKYGLKVIEDCAQAHGAVYKPRKKRAGSMGEAGCFSFYPTKNLGAFGDGGMIVINSKKAYRRLRILRDTGRSSHYMHTVKGYNSRLDTLQAVALRLKLRHLDKWNKMRQANARIYTSLFKAHPDIIYPYEAAYSSHVYHIYALQVKNRSRVFEHLKKKGIGAMVHYPVPLHLQKAYKDLGYMRGDFPIAERIARRIISLPMHPFLKRSQIEYVAGEVLRVSG
ncbi:MAG: DegT/DnrJ/EryC1/StrS family aminotransferase [Candidatus Omnitrophica bacterium]|nr:DegT/DnrJ/EryC1/StrS family aminotransferase [Candidatus Omnitrophota bacterium]MBU1872047.1 DegT/DnrJ/EryC1/StrS family aminotransferase [Candidatus Omnitrophota bacterium]